MKPIKQTNYKEMNKAAAEYGLVGKDGKYETKNGISIDLSATRPDTLAVGYTVAKTLERLVTKEG